MMLPLWKGTTRKSLVGTGGSPSSCCTAAGISSRGPRGRGAQMVAAAFASAYHGRQLGTAENVALGDHQIAKVASHVGQPALALHYARRALEAIEIGHFGNWQVGGAYEGMG